MCLFLLNVYNLVLHITHYLTVLSTELLYHLYHCPNIVQYGRQRLQGEDETTIGKKNFPSKIKINIIDIYVFRFNAPTTLLLRVVFLEKKTKKQKKPAL